MSADIGAPNARLTLPEGYATREAGGGRLAIYETYTGLWIGEVDPLLSNAQELADSLLDANEAARREARDSAGGYYL